MEIERKQYKCMTCGEIYEEGNLPTIKDKIGDGCCSIGSLIEINENKIESGKFPKTNIESDNTIGDMKVYGTIDKRYYTPTLDEFKLRFEYEFKDWFTQYGIDAITGIRRSDWQKTEIKEEAYWSTEAVERMNGGKYGPDYQHTWDRIRYYIENNQIRVKYLDRSDIESLGWSEKNNSFSQREFKLMFGDDCITLSIIKEHCIYFVNSINDGDHHFTISLHNTSTMTNSEDIAVIFNGTIKNKSELKILLKQLNIL